MCGRFIVSYSYSDLLKFLSSTFDIFDLDESIEVPKYNVAPGTNVICVISDGSAFRAGTLHWGFIPYFAKDKNIGYKMINARIESVANKVSFKDSFINKRCLILADGYFEWKKVNHQKQPFLIQKQDKELFFFAGLWSKYVSPNDEVIYSTTIITKEACDELSAIHDRMPVILNESNAKEWLDKDIIDPLRLKNILDNSIVKDFTTLRVSEYVNNARNQSEKCIEEFFEESLF